MEHYLDMWISRSCTHLQRLTLRFTSEPLRLALTQIRFFGCIVTPGMRFGHLCPEVTGAMKLRTLTSPFP